LYAEFFFLSFFFDRGTTKQAIKLKERKIPPIAELVAMSAGAYSREDVKVCSIQSGG